MRVIILDNYDSFTFNLYQYLGELGEKALVFRNDEVTVAELRGLQPTSIVLSPGPGDPRVDGYFGVCGDVIRDLGPEIPILGVCLGHQGIVAAFGGEIVRAPEVMHGKTSAVHHGGAPLFSGVPTVFQAMRYHSLVADPDLPDCLELTAWTDDGVVMGVGHRRFPIHGVQFHPESIGTPVGKTLLSNFLRLS